VHNFLFTAREDLAASPFSTGPEALLAHIPDARRNPSQTIHQLFKHVFLLVAIAVARADSVIGLSFKSERADEHRRRKFR
jgi:hypothetical protein